METVEERLRKLELKVKDLEGNLQHYSLQVDKLTSKINKLENEKERN